MRTEGTKRIQKSILQKLNKILINQVRFFLHVIIFRCTKMLQQIADLFHSALCPCALMSAPLCRATFCLRPYVWFQKDGAREELPGEN